MAKEYKLIATSDKCYFDTNDIALETGLHTFVVKAKAEGFTDSPYSNEVEAEIKGGYTLTFGPWDDNYDSTRFIETITFADGTSRTIGEEEHLSNTSFNNVVSVTLIENDGEWWTIQCYGFNESCTSIHSGETVTLTLAGNATLDDYLK